MDWKELMHNKVFIRTRYEKFYNGVILDVQKIRDNEYIKLRDKFGHIVFILYDEVAEINVEGIDDGTGKDRA